MSYHDRSLTQSLPLELSPQRLLLLELLHLMLTTSSNRRLQLLPGLSSSSTTFRDHRCRTPRSTRRRATSTSHHDPARTRPQLHHLPTLSLIARAASTSSSSAPPAPYSDLTPPPLLPVVSSPTSPCHLAQPRAPAPRLPARHRMQPSSPRHLIATSSQPPTSRDSPRLPVSLTPSTAVAGDSLRRDPLLSPPPRQLSPQPTAAPPPRRRRPSHRSNPARSPQT